MDLNVNGRLVELDIDDVKYDDLVIIGNCVRRVTRPPSGRTERGYRTFTVAYPDQPHGSTCGTWNVKIGTPVLVLRPAAVHREVHSTEITVEVTAVVYEGSGLSEREMAGTGWDEIRGMEAPVVTVAYPDGRRVDVDLEDDDEEYGHQA